MNRELFALLLIAFTVVGFYAAISSGIPAIAKFILAVAILACCSFSIQRLLKLEGEAGMLLIRTTRGLKELDELAQRAPKLWGFLADIGLVMSFGLLSLYLFKKTLPKRTFIVGFFCLLVFWQIVLPAAAPLALELISMPAASKELGSIAGGIATSNSNPLYSLVLLFVQVVAQSLIYIGGIALVSASAVILSATDILFKIAEAIYLFITQTIMPSEFPALQNASSVLARAGPGVTPIIPGLQIPFTEGILALIIMLVVHEGAHAVLARIAKIPLNSAGIVLFGIIPIGAFVDPDEKKLVKTDDDAQNRVLVAGSTANLFTAAFFLISFLAFSYALLSLYPADRMDDSYLRLTGVASNGTAYGTLESGMLVTSWRGVNISTIAEFASAGNGTVEGEIIPVTVAKNFEVTSCPAGSPCTVGLYGEANLTIVAGANGKAGISATEYRYGFLDHVRAFWQLNPVLPFLFNFLGLAFVLNVLVGMVNLLPIPPFDGFRIVALSVGDRILFGKTKAIDAIIIVIVVAFFINVLPWLWTA